MVAEEEGMQVIWLHLDQQILVVVGEGVTQQPHCLMVQMVAVVSLLLRIIHPLLKGERPRIGLGACTILSLKIIMKAEVLEMAEAELF